MDEVWAPVSGTKGRFLVSTHGRVVGPKKGLLRAHKNSRGYARVTIWVDGLQVSKDVHRMVAETFMGVPRGTPINHIDGNKMNAALSNLERTTTSGNTLHAYRVLEVGRARAVLVAKHGSPPIRYPSGRAAAAALGISQSSLSAAARSGSPLHGYEVRFA